MTIVYNANAVPMMIMVHASLWYYTVDSETKNMSLYTVNQQYDIVLLPMYTNTVFYTVKLQEKLLLIYIYF